MGRLKTLLSAVSKHQEHLDLFWLTHLHFNLVCQMERQDTWEKRESFVRINDPASRSRRLAATDSEHDGSSDNDGTDSTATATTQETANLSRFAANTPHSQLVAVVDAHPLTSLHIPSRQIGPENPSHREEEHSAEPLLQFKAESKQRSGVTKNFQDPPNPDKHRANREGHCVDTGKDPKLIAGSSCLKMLVTNNVAGSIIGKSGETILKLQRNCSCRIKLSQARDFFPGTSDRVCLLQGENIESIRQAVEQILEKFRDVREGQNVARGLRNNQEDSDGEIVIMVRILVPNPACGMIIGR